MLKIIVITTALLALNSFCEEVEQPPPEEKELHEEVLDISMKMWEVSADLRDDRYDKTVQIKTKEIEGRIEKLIKDAEEEEKRQGEENSKEKGNGKTKPKHRQIDENIYKDHYYDEWKHRIDLAKIARDGLTQTYAKELPIRWERRIAAYFISITADESARENLPKNSTKTNKK